MGKIKKFFQKTGVAIATLVVSVVAAVGIGRLKAPADFSIIQEIGNIGLGMVVIGAVVVGAGIAKHIYDSEKKKELGMQKNPELGSPKQTMNDVFEGSQKDGKGNRAEQFGRKIGENAERIGEKVGQGANRLGVEIGKLFGDTSRPNSSANPYSSTYNNGSNPYSSRDRMSAGYGGTYNGQNYGPSATGDVRNSQGYGQPGQPGQPGQSGGYYSGRNSGKNYNNRNYYNGNGYNNNNYNNTNYNNANYNSNNNYYNSNTSNNNNSYRQNNQSYNQNVQYGTYQNSRPQKTPDTSGLEESAKTNYFENEPGSSSYRSGPLKKEKI